MGTCARETRSKSVGESLPFEDFEGAESGRVGEGRRFVDTAAGPHSWQVGDVFALLPDLPPLFDEILDAVRPQPLGLGHHACRWRQLVDRDLACDVLLAQGSQRM